MADADDPLTHLSDLLIHSLYFHGAKISRLLFWHVTFLGKDNSKHFVNSRPGTSGISASSLSPKTSSKNRDILEYSVGYCFSFEDEP